MRGEEELQKGYGIEDKINNHTKQPFHQKLSSIKSALKCVGCIYENYLVISKWIRKASFWRAGKPQKPLKLDWTDLYPQAYWNWNATDH